MALAAPVGDSTHVGMGQVALGGADSTFTAVLGSCVGVAIFHPRLKLAAFAHIVLPDSSGRNGTPGKFADTAIPYMLQQLAARGANSGGLRAKIAGGACMFGAGGPLQIGEANVAAVTKLLAKAGIPIVSQDVGGNKGRRVTFNVLTNELTVQIAGEPAKVI